MGFFLFQRVPPPSPKFKPGPHPGGEDGGGTTRKRRRPLPQPRGPPDPGFSQKPGPRGNPKPGRRTSPGNSRPEGAPDPQKGPPRAPRGPVKGPQGGPPPRGRGAGNLGAGDVLGPLPGGPRGGAGSPFRLKRPFCGAPSGPQTKNPGTPGAPNPFGIPPGFFSPLRGEPDPPWVLKTTVLGG